MPELASNTAPSTVGSSSHLSGRTIHKLFWRLIPLLFILYVVNYLDRINVGFAALQMQPQLGLSDRVYGLGAGIFFIGYLGFQVPSNLAMTRVGAHRWIAAIIVVWGVISSCMIFIRTAHEFYAMRFLLGVAESGFFPGIVLYLKNWIPAQSRARGMALFMTGIPIAGVVGGPISGALLEMHAGPLAGWQWLFLLEGAPAVLLGLLTLASLPEAPGTARWLQEDERAWLISELQREHESQPESARDWHSVFVDLRVWLLTLSYFGITTCMYGLVYFVPKIIRGVSTSSELLVGLLSAVPYLVATVSMVLVGVHSDRSRERRVHLAVLGIVGAFGAVAAGWAGSATATILLLSLAIAGGLSMLGPFWALAAGMLGEGTAAAGIAFINSVGNLGGFLGPYSVGLLRNVSGSMRGGMIVVGAAALMAGLVVFSVRSNKFSQ